MTVFEMTRQEASALAKFLELLRQRVPGPDWDKPGIEDALGRARGMAASPALAQAAIRAAENPANRTPAVIGMEGPHWVAASTPRRVKYEPGNTCSICSHSPDACRMLNAGDHEFVSVEQARAQAASDETRAELVAQAHAGVTPRPPAPPQPTLAERVEASPRVAEMKEATKAAREALAMQREAEV